MVLARDEPEEEEEGVASERECRQRGQLAARAFRAGNRRANIVTEQWGAEERASLSSTRRQLQLVLFWTDSSTSRVFSQRVPCSLEGVVKWQASFRKKTSHRHSPPPPSGHLALSQRPRLLALSVTLLGPLLTKKTH